MKKALLSAGMVAMSVLAFGQTQRTILAEEFTQASCGPCAAQNPTFQALLNANAGKVIEIKYQTSWPGYDPMNQQNPTEVATRVSYYGVTGVPNARLDGAVINGSNYAGAPSNWDQSKLTTRYAITSPFFLTASHVANAKHDSVTVTVQVKAAQAYSQSDMFVRVALVEKDINFASAPGSNGEKDFHGVMRKMLPNATGTSIKTSWADQETLDLSWTIPTPNYIYNLSQVRVVAFIQTDATKEVLQAAYSAPVVRNDYAGIPSLNPVPGIFCSNFDVNPVVTLKNMGNTTITKAVIKYKIGTAGTPQSHTWTGSLAATQTTTVNLPTIATTYGNNVIYAYVESANDVETFATTTATGTTVLRGTPSAIANGSLVQGFETPTEVDKSSVEGGWQVVSGNNGAKIGGAGASRQAAYIFLNSLPMNTEASVYIQRVNLTGINDPQVSFHYAYAQVVAGQTDQLDVYASSDCGATWTNVWSKSGNDLATTAPSNQIWAPTPGQHKDWRRGVADLTGMGNQGAVMVKFTVTARSGNTMLLDDVSINSANVLASVEEEVIKTADVTVYPNPVNGVGNVTVSSANDQNVSIELTNLMGQTVRSIYSGSVAAGDQNFEFNTTGLAAGVYMVKVNTAEGSTVVKINVTQ